MSDLFQSTNNLSPRLTWLRSHDLRVTEYQHAHSLNGNARFVCSNRAQTRWACGDTEDATEQAYCERYNLTWWKLADWNGAMDDIKQVRAFSPVDESTLVTTEPAADWDF